MKSNTSLLFPCFPNVKIRENSLSHKTDVDKSTNRNLMKQDTHVRHVKNKNLTSRTLRKEITSGPVARTPHVHITGHGLDCQLGELRFYMPHGTVK